MNHTTWKLGILLGTAWALSGCNHPQDNEPTPAPLDTPPAVTVTPTTPSQPTGDPNAVLQITGASFELVDPEVDESIELTPSGGGGGITEAQPGGTINVSITFNAPNQNVVGFGIQFGNLPVQVVEVPAAQGQSSGQLNAQIDIPDSVCNNLSSICHDIKCYEFAVTDVGKVSKSNINSIALACGNCDEPSCQDLLTSCQEEDCGGQCTADEVCIDDQCMLKNAATSCEERDPSCCPGQDNSCTAPDSQCFCDAYCAEAGDCCPDACSFCGFCG